MDNFRPKHPSSVVMFVFALKYILMFRTICCLIYIHNSSY